MKKKAHNNVYKVDDLEEKIIELSVQLKKKQREVDELTEANYSLLRKLAHNLKNPIGSVFSFSELLLETPGNWSEEKLTKYLEIINHSAKFSIDTLNAFSKYNSLFSNKVNLTLKKVNLIELLNEVIIKIEREFENEKITLNKNFTQQNIEVELDNDEISLAFYHLLKNAIKFSKLDYKEINISVELTSKFVNITIEDFGIGVSKEDLKQITNPFFVVNTYTEQKEKCIGLGLTIAKKIIENHKGEILIESELQKGTIVTVTLPLN